MTISARIIGKIDIPKLDFTGTLMEVGKKDVASRLAKNIQKGIDVQESPYPPLAPSTIKEKGHSRPLILTGKLHRSFQVFKKGKNAVLIRIKTERRQIAHELQIDGIRTKKGKRFFNFFGVSTRMEVDGTRRMEKEVKKRISNAGR